MSRVVRYISLFFVGAFLGLLFLLWKQPELLLFTQRESLESGSVWTQQETVPAVPTDAPQPKIKILFGGDVMLDRHIRTMAQETSYDALLSEDLQQLLANHDLVVVNLEGPITDNPSRSVGSVPGSTDNFFFTFDPEVTQFLLDHNMRLVNLGNNHMDDFGVGGIISTLNYLSQARIEHFGWVASSEEMEEYNQEYLVLEVDDFLLGFVNFNQFGNQPFTSAIEAVEMMVDEVDYLIVYTHWGNEYVPEAGAVIVNQAHQLVDAGADLIIGSHPHVIQPYEDYQGKRIYYSLGNFIFDQYFSPEVRRGQLVQLTLEKGLIDEDRPEEEVEVAASFDEFEVLMTSRQPVELVEEEAVESDESSSEGSSIPPEADTYND